MPDNGPYLEKVVEGILPGLCEELLFDAAERSFSKTLQAHHHPCEQHNTADIAICVGLEHETGEESRTVGKAAVHQDARGHQVETP